jgi:EAL domain-containing protein (putative c-di-GMP-specific phosphodiesterase class I)
MPEKEAGCTRFQPNRISRAEILDLLDNDGLTSWFQPVFSRRTGEVFGYEALARLREKRTPPLDIGELFQRAQAEGLISTLDMECREHAFCRAAELGFAERNAYLYVNICPATLMHPDHRGGATDRLAEECGIAKERVILEITEQESIRNYDLFKKSVEYYRKRGYKIAIDDFGVGYGGLKMLSVIEPDYLKVDRHFITNIDRDSFKHNLVDAIATVCHKLGITVIAEGIERPEELETLARFDIDLLQGYLLERPGPDLSRQRLAPLVVREDASYCPESHGESCTIGDTVKYIEPLSPRQSLMAAHQRFMDDVKLQGIPVVDEQRVLGMLNRMHFLEKQMVGPHGYGFALSAHRTVKDVLGDDFLLVEAATPMEEVVRRIKARHGRHLYDDICVARNGKYLGTVAINALLEAITRKSIQLAKGANPLSGLPGNEFIQRTVATFLQRKVNFDVCYIDIDDFKRHRQHRGMSGEFLRGAGFSRLRGQAGGQAGKRLGHRPQQKERLAIVVACFCRLGEFASRYFPGGGNGWPDRGRIASSIPRLWCPGCSRWGRDVEKPHGGRARFWRCRCVWPPFPRRWSGWGCQVPLGFSCRLSLSRRMVKVEPLPSSLVTPTSPPCAWTMCLTMASPRPVPPSLRLRAASLR